MAFLGLPVGLLLGLVLQRSDFCMHSVAREIAARRLGPQARAYLAALAVQMLVVNALSASGRLAVSLPPVAPAGAVLGGLLFGVGMVLASG